MCCSCSCSLPQYIHENSTPRISWMFLHHSSTPLQNLKISTAAIEGLIMREWHLNGFGKSISKHFEVGMERYPSSKALSENYHVSRWELSRVHALLSLKSLVCSFFSSFVKVHGALHSILQRAQCVHVRIYQKYGGGRISSATRIRRAAHVSDCKSISHFVGISREMSLVYVMQFPGRRARDRSCWIELARCYSWCLTSRANRETREEQATYIGKLHGIRRWRGEKWRYAERNEKSRRVG